MIENSAPSTHGNAVQAARDVLEWLDQFGTMIGLDPEVVHRANYASLRTSDLRSLIVAAHRVDQSEGALRSAQRGLIRMERQRDALRAAACRAAGVDPDEISETDTDYEALIADVVRRVPPVPHVETGACYVLVPDTESKARLVRECGAVMWIDPAGDMNSNWRCAAGHDETTPDA